ncbi:MAG: translation initiation factor IF-3 [Patescibacteria group bacterium]|nr:translation initiation factor IF-3 [Patescibacteria group bacterium]
MSRKPTTNNKDQKRYRINEDIRSKLLYVIDGEGEVLGNLSLSDALEEASRRNLDLVEVSPNAKPPVAKILDYGKMLYNLAKNERKSKKTQVQTKGVRLTFGMERHDLDVRINQAKRFFEKGSKVKVSMRMAGRQLAHADLGKGKMLEFYTEISELAKIEGDLTRHGNTWDMTLVPIK